MKTYICPHCGKNQMIKQKQKDNTYFLICQKCGYKQGSLPTDKKHGVT